MIRQNVSAQLDLKYLKETRYPGFIGLFPRVLGQFVREEKTPDAGGGSPENDLTGDAAGGRGGPRRDTSGYVGGHHGL